jgi:glycerophosphoryl diester phosphodiesterase
VLLVGRRGNPLHAPENTAVSLLSAYTAGADALHFDLRRTLDGALVLTAREVEKQTLAELRRIDWSADFHPRGSPDFKYRQPGRAGVPIETFPEVLDVLPDEVPLLIEVHSGADELARAFAERELTERVTVCSSDPRVLRDLKGMKRVLVLAEKEDSLAGLDVDGVMLPAALLKPLERELEKLPLGALVLVPPDGDLDALRKKSFVSAALVDSVSEVRARPSWTWLEESFAGKNVDTRRFALGYAKANKYAHVFQDDGIHVDIAEYDGQEQPAAPGSVEAQLQDLEARTWYALKDWPFYSGGGVGIVRPLEGDFRIEVDFGSERACQATMLEMAVTNVDPARHQPPWNPDGTPRLPQTIRDKAEFYNPHGAPPFVGAEHDEDDGYRINWNLGAEYDDNQYGHPSGDGLVLTGRLGLERRGSYFSAYYRNEADAKDWVCVGAVCNESMNERVFVRCAGKRWRQETDADPSKYWPIVPNKFVFRNLSVTRYG